MRGQWAGRWRIEQNLDGFLVAHRGDVLEVGRVEDQALLDVLDHQRAHRELLVGGVGSIVPPADFAWMRVRSLPPLRPRLLSHSCGDVCLGAEGWYSSGKP